MKFTMKKVFALLIATIVCLSLVACGENATEETSGTTNQTTNESTEHEANASSEKDELKFVGTWVGTTNGNDTMPVKMIINEDGTGSWEESGETQELTWAIENDEFVITRPNNGFLNFAYTTTNDVIELNYEDGIYVLTLE
ncbi:MAG: hypothetical protein IKT45_00675 [Lachnospiraceae bacterium]|nr:hypothetical protein [Lachnospiraceae bacterium]